MNPCRHFITPHFNLVPRSPGQPDPPPAPATVSGEPQPSLEPSSSTGSPARAQCAFTSTDGRRCRMFRTADHPELCGHHAQQELKSLDRTPTLPLAATLIGPIQDFRSAAAINAVMGNAFVQLADGRLDPRRAAILTYMAQLIMQTVKQVGWDEFSHRNSPKPSLERALKTSLKAAIPKSEAEKLIRTIYAAAVDEAGPGALT